MGDVVNYTVPTEKTYSGEWKVIGIENGQVKLMATKNISNKTLNGNDATIGVWNEKTKSYANAEKALDDECAAYLNSKQATSVRSVRVEDIDKITGYDKTTYGKGTIGQYGNKVTYSIDSNGNVAYSSKVKNGTSTYITFKMPQATENITSYEIISNYYCYNAEQETELKDKNSDVYKMLFGKGYEYYWLASSYVNPGEGITSFGMYLVASGGVFSSGLWNSDGYVSNNECGVRPVVFLKSDTSLTQISENSGKWNIE